MSRVKREKILTRYIGHQINHLDHSTKSTQRSILNLLLAVLDGITTSISKPVLNWDICNLNSVLYNCIKK